MDRDAPRYDLRHETREAHCIWCWEAIPGNRPHMAVHSQRFPTPLRFHHRCWPQYRAASGIEGVEARALYRTWNPARVEHLRIHAGLTIDQFAAKLRVSIARLRTCLAGEGKFGQKVIARIKGLAVDTRFERREAGSIDWADRRTVFSLCMHLKWNCGELGRRLGVRDNTVSAWWDRGLPATSVRHAQRLSVLARQHGFDAGMVVDDRLWTPELARQAIAASGVTQQRFSDLAGFTVTTLRDALGSKRRLTRQMAYGLTVAAAKLSLPLPVAGRIGPKRRQKRPFPGGYDPLKLGTRWKPEELALLGTMPDRAVAERLGTRTAVAVRRIRRILKLKRINNQKWDGVPQPCPVDLDEVIRRYESHLNGEPAPS